MKYVLVVTLTSMKSGDLHVERFEFSDETLARTAKGELHHAYNLAASGIIRVTSVILKTRH